MATRPIKMAEKTDQLKMLEKSEVQLKMPEKSEIEVPSFSQAKRPETGRFFLQVDRQTKGSYQTAEAAHLAGLVIKKAHPIVHVSIYDSVETENTVVNLPA
jgi:hypothetical protein